MAKVFTEAQVKKWVQEGTDKSTIDKAYLIGWNLVAPKNQVDELTTNVVLSTKFATIKTAFKDLNEKEKTEVLGVNKDQALTTSQIRIAFGELRRIQMNEFSKPDSISSFLMLKPKLAYAVKRHDKAGLKIFYELFTMAYDAVDTTDTSNRANHFKNMIQLIEAVLAYHKYHGGKE
jgi:CRISPR-associated protein Csm2